MDIQYLKKIIKIFDDSSAEDLEIEEKGIKIRVSKRNENENQNNNAPIINLSGGVPMQSGGQPQQHVAPPAPQQQTASSAETEAAEAEAAGLHEIKSPIVGTFYDSPSPDSKPYVEVGQKVKKGQVLCIVEAMKLMNEIESDIDGTIEKIIAKDSEAVEYNQTLFLIKPE